MSVIYLAWWACYCTLLASGVKGLWWVLPPPPSGLSHVALLCSVPWLCARWNALPCPVPVLRPGGLLSLALHDLSYCRAVQLCLGSASINRTHTFACLSGDVHSACENVCHVILWTQSMWKCHLAIEHV